MENQTKSYETIVAYLQGELSQSEMQTIEDWITTSSENKVLFDTYKEKWLSQDNFPMVSINKETVWNNISEYVRRDMQKATKTFTKATIYRIAGVAASIALLIGIFSSLLVKSTLDNISGENAITYIETPKGQKMRMTLPDQTKVFLNSGSTLSYSQNFNKNNREIILVGEAYFEVAKDADKEFIVTTSDVKVVVKGTSFEVSAYEDDAQIGVSLVEGIVHVTDLKDKLLSKMSPNESFKVNKGDMQFVLAKNIKQALPLWTLEQLAFYNADLFEVVRKIERWYGVNINLINPVVEQKYTFSVKDEPLASLLDHFNKITPIEYTIEGKEVTIKCK